MEMSALWTVAFNAMACPTGMSSVVFRTAFYTAASSQLHVRPTTSAPDQHIDDRLQRAEAELMHAPDPEQSAAEHGTEQPRARQQPEPLRYEVHPSHSPHVAGTVEHRCQHVTRAVENDHCAQN